MKKKRILLGLGAFAVLGFATVLASCDAKKFTVRFYDGETELTELAETVTNGYNAEVPTAPTKDGKVFNGWYKDANLTEAYDFGSIVSGDVSIYARWETQMHTVNLYTEKGKLWKSVSIANGKTLTFEGTPTKNYRIFSGTWYTDAECKNAFNASTAITKATDLYAGWVGETESVDFEFLASDFPTGTVGADGWSSGCFSAGEGSEFRTESGKSYNGVSYTHGVKLNGTKSFFAINAEGTGKITVVMADRGGLQAVNLQGPGDDEPKEKSLTVASKVAALEIDVDQVGLYKISLANNGGTPDIMYVKYETSVLKSAPESIDITGYKTQFLEGTDFTVADLAAELNYENGRKDAIDKTALVVDSTAFDKTKAGTYTIKVKYSITDSYDTYNLEKTYDVQVLALDDIELGFNKVA